MHHGCSSTLKLELLNIFIQYFKTQKHSYSWIIWSRFPEYDNLISWESICCSLKPPEQACTPRPYFAILIFQLPAAWPAPYILFSVLQSFLDGYCALFHILPTDKPQNRRANSNVSESNYHFPPSQLSILYIYPIAMTKYPTESDIRGQICILTYNLRDTAHHGTRGIMERTRSRKLRRNKAWISNNKACPHWHFLSSEASSNNSTTVQNIPTS